MKILPLATIVATLVTSGSLSATVLFGNIVEFGGPDDLLLDPSTAVIAVDVNGDTDRAVNGVIFLSDGQGGTSGTATAGAVSVTTSAANQINNWTSPQAYTGDATSAANLSEIMRDIRWEAAPAALNVNVAGLDPGGTYNVQLLFNEGADRDRFWDIAVGGSLVVDNFSSEGEGVWTPNNGFAYTGNFTADGSGVIDIDMAANLGGDDRSLAPGSDGNPILQAVVVHVPEPSSAALLALAAFGLAARRRRH